MALFRVSNLVLGSYSAWMVSKHFVRDLRHGKSDTTLFMTEPTVLPDLLQVFVIVFALSDHFGNSKKVVVTRAGPA